MLHVAALALVITEIVCKVRLCPAIASASLYCDGAVAAAPNGFTFQNGPLNWTSAPDVVA